MWNNKMDNITVYHRPYFNTDPRNTAVEFVSRKIKRQPTVGIRGFHLFEMDFKSKRFLFNGVDPMREALEKKGLYFGYKPKEEVTGKQRWEAWEALTENDKSDDTLPF
jgi:hypothetical protein